MDEPMLTPQEVAKRLKVSSQSVYRYIQRGIFRDVVEAGGLFKKRYLIPEREVERIRRAVAEGTDLRNKLAPAVA